MSRPRRAVVILGTVALLLAPQRAAAQQTDDWSFSFMPLYFWASSMDGHLTAGPVTTPVFLDFGTAADNLANVFTFHFEAAKGRWGMLTDLNFIRLGTTSQFTVGPQGQVVTGDAELDNVMFELGGSYLAHEASRLGIIGGLRTYTISPKLTFSSAGTTLTPIDASKTSANAFVGLTLRPQLSEKWSLFSRADVGGGNADFTWSAELGLEYRFRNWGGLVFGYKGLGIDVEEDAADSGVDVRKYDVTHYGPLVGFNFHWGAR